MKESFSCSGQTAFPIARTRPLPRRASLCSALPGSPLLVGCPGRGVSGVRQRGAVYRFRRQADDQWLGLGEMEPPQASQTEFGIEVAVSAEWTAAGSLGSAAESTSLDSRVRLVSIDMEPPATPIWWRVRATDDHR